MCIINIDACNYNVDKNVTWLTVRCGCWLRIRRHVSERYLTSVYEHVSVSRYLRTIAHEIKYLKNNSSNTEQIFQPEPQTYIIRVKSNITVYEIITHVIICRKMQKYVIVTLLVDGI